MVRGVQIALVLVLCGSAASPAAEPHPLDALTVREHWTVYDVLRGSGNLDAKTRFAAVRLHPPPKAEVLAWKPGEPFRREAFAAIVKNGRTFEAVVDVANRKLASWTPMPDAQASLTLTEDDAVTELVKQDEKFLSALRQRGITDLAMLDCWGNSPGYFGRPEEREKRLAQVFCSDRHGVFNSIGRPIEGLSVLVDVAAGKVLKVIDTGVVPMPRGPVDLDEEGIGEARPAPEPITVEQPRGPSFRVNGHEVAWQRWRFHFRVEPRRGVVVSQVGYEDGDRIRSVMYEGGLSELFVPYMDPAIGWYNLTYLDAGDYGGAGLARPLESGSECPANGVFFDSVVADDRGAPQQVPRAACLFERLGGEVAWTHRDKRIVAARARRDLVLRWATTLGNYDYVFDWTFRPDGSIDVVIGATGVVSVKAVRSRTAAEPAEAGTRDDAYGRFVAEHTVAVNHDHFFCFRLDLDVDGPTNSFVVDRLTTRTLPKDNARRSLWVVESRTAARESEAQLDVHQGGEGYWRIVNPAAIGPLGYPTSYEIRPGHGASSLLLPEDYPQKRAAFTRHALWITPQRDAEVYAAGEHTLQSRGGEGLPAWTAADRNIEKADVVAWYTLGMHHVVRAEDWPVMPTVYHSFEIRPFDFFARNPALDLPKQP
jgi:primary-amine oxidase